MICLIREEYDFTMMLHDGTEVGVLTSPTLDVSIFRIKQDKIIESDPNELFDDDDWIKYHDLHKETIHDDAHNF